MKAANASWKLIGIAAGKSKDAVKRLYQRNRLLFDLPPKEKVRKGKMKGRLALAVKKAIIDDKKTSLPTIRGKLKTKIESETPINNMPSKSTIGNFIKKAGFKKRRLQNKFMISEKN